MWTPDGVVISTAPGPPGCLAPPPVPRSSSEPGPDFPQPFSRTRSETDASKRIVDIITDERGNVQRLARNQAGSLLLQPLVVSIRKSVSEGSFRSRLPCRSAGTTQMFQPAAWTPTISQAAWKVPGLLRSPSPSGPRLKLRKRLSGDQSTW